MTRAKVDECAVRKQAANDWRCTPALRAEFTTEEAFTAYSLAVARGLTASRKAPERQVSAAARSN